MRDTPHVSKTSGTNSSPILEYAAARNLTSNPTLWPTTKSSGFRNIERPSNASSISGASATMSSVIPVMSVISWGIGMDGFTRVWNSDTLEPLMYLTAAMSIISSLAGDRPVVSRSSTT